MISMAYRDLVSHGDLLSYLRDSHDLFVYFIDIFYPDAVEKYLGEYREEFIEYCNSELGMGFTE